MQIQLDDIKKNVNAMTTKLDKVIAIDAKRQLEVEARLTTAEVRIGILSRISILTIVAVVSSFFNIVKTKLGL